MPAETVVSVEEYLSTSYRPDRDYVDGELLERNAGEHDHGWLQLAIASWLWTRAAQLRIRPLTEVRLQVTPTRFRIPDILVLPYDAPRDPIVRTGPLLCVDILSREDTMRAIMGRIQDYLEMGVPVCWIVEPVDRLAWIADSNGLHDVKDGMLRAGDISLPLSDVWPRA